MQFTDRNIRDLKLEKGKTEGFWFDDDRRGFGIRIREGGSKRYIYQYTIGTEKTGIHQRRMTLGSVTEISLKDAISRWRAAADKRQEGKDPAIEKRKNEEKSVREAVETFEWAAKQFLESKKREVKPGYYQDMERHLLDYAKPLHNLPLEMDLRTIADLLGKFERKNQVHTYNRLRASLSALYDYCRAKGWCNSNPVEVTDRKKEVSRDRILNEFELKALLASAGNDQFGSIIKLLILTGARRTEIGDLRWSEVGWDRNEIILSADRVKNGREHVIPMSKAVRNILKAQVRNIGRDQVFGVGNGAGGFAGWSAAKNELDARIAKKWPASNKPMPHWQLHDLRRTAATWMAESPPKGLGIQPHIIEAVLNHVSGSKSGVAGIYNRASYDVEKRAALQAWADHLEGKKMLVLKSA